MCVNQTETFPRHINRWFVIRFWFGDLLFAIGWCCLQKRQREIWHMRACSEWERYRLFMWMQCVIVAFQRVVLRAQGECVCFFGLKVIAASRSILLRKTSVKVSEWMGESNTWKLSWFVREPCGGFHSMSANVLFDRWMCNCCTHIHISHRMWMRIGFLIFSSIQMLHNSHGFEQLLGLNALTLFFCLARCVCYKRYQNICSHSHTRKRDWHTTHEYRCISQLYGNSWASDCIKGETVSADAVVFYIIRSNTLVHCHFCNWEHVSFVCTVVDFCVSCIFFSVSFARDLLCPFQSIFFKFK